MQSPTPTCDQGCRGEDHSGEPGSGGAYSAAVAEVCAGRLVRLQRTI